MKIFQSLGRPLDRPLGRRQSFTLVELLIVISIIAILASLAFPAFQKAIDKANETKVVSNGKQIYLASQQAALDAAQNGTETIGWPGDMTTAPTTPTAYFTALVTNGYLQVADLKILLGPGYVAMTGTNVNALNDGQNNAFGLGMVEDNDQSSAILLFTKNWTPGGGASGAIATGTITTYKPFGNKAFVIVHKGGDAAAFQGNLATDTTGLLGTVPSGNGSFLQGTVAH